MQLSKNKPKLANFTGQQLSKTQLKYVRGGGTNTTDDTGDTHDRKIKFRRF